MILVVDDDPDDIVFTKRLLAKARVENPVFELQDGEAAMKFLELAIKEDELPGLVLLDINMPRVTGFDVLAWARGNERLRALPIVMLTSSDDDRDQRRAKSLRADGYLTKITSPQALADVVRAACGEML